MLASASISLMAMDAPDLQQEDLNNKLWKAISYGDLNEIKKLISAGASLNPPKTAHNPLDTVIFISSLRSETRLEIIKLLLNNGARVDALSSGYNHTPLMSAAEQGTPNEAFLLLTTIPLDEQEYIRNTFPIFSKKMRTTNFLDKDTHGVVQKHVLAQLVEQQMQRIAYLLAMKSSYPRKTAHEYGLENQDHQEAMGRLLDLNNPESYEKIRKQVENNIKRILFAPQQNINK